MERLITIDVFGQAYTFKAESDVADLSVVTEYLMREIRRVEAQQAGRPVERNRFAMLLQTALNLANDNVSLRLQLNELVTHVAGRSQRLIGLLDDGIQIQSTGKSAV